MQTDEKRAAFIACSKKLLDYFIPFRIRCSPFVYDKHRTKGKNGVIFLSERQCCFRFLPYCLKNRRPRDMINRLVIRRNTV